VSRPAIVAAYEVPYTRHPEPTATTRSLLASAVAGAADRAGLRLRDLDGLGVSSFVLQPDHAIDLAWHLGLEASWLMDGALGGAAALDMLQHAMHAIEAGDAKAIALVAGGRADPEAFAKLTGNFNAVTAEHLAPIPYGGPNTLFSLLTRRHMMEHGLAREDYAQVPIAQRRWAEKNPRAVYRSPLTLDMYLEAPMVTEPLCLFDCVPVVTGADAVVVTRYDPGRHERAVGIEALRCSYNYDNQEHDGLRTGLGRLAESFWSDARSAPELVDVVSVYDDYPVMVLIQLADLGFGTVREILEAVRTGRLALNTSGGLLSAGQASSAGGMHGLVEVVTQLRGEADERQVPNCKTGLVTNYGMVLYRYGSCASAALLQRV
jgi:acetyl-CoA acetyltransferase